ncbi:MAG: hypothetical protein WCA63_08030 [Gallionella sp.]
MSRISIHFAGELRCRVLAHSSPTDCGMSRHSLRGSLQCLRDTVGRSPLVRERGAAGLPAPNASHRRVRPAIPQK